MDPIDPTEMKRLTRLISQAKRRYEKDPDDLDSAIQYAELRQYKQRIERERLWAKAKESVCDLCQGRGVTREWFGPSNTGFSAEIACPKCGQSCPSCHGTRKIMRLSVSGHGMFSVPCPACDPPFNPDEENPF